jgi:hypothetical protein
VGNRRSRRLAWVDAVALPALLVAAVAGCSEVEEVDPSRVDAHEVDAPNADAGGAAPGQPYAAAGTLAVTVDPEGRPYDTAMPADAALERERLATLALPRGELVIVGGEYLTWLAPGDGEGMTVDLGDAEAYDVEVVRLRFPDSSSPAGLVFVASDATVAEWSAFDDAYGTDAGMGATTSPAFVELNGPRSNLDKELAVNGWLERLNTSENPLVEDLDGLPGPETLVFSNGWGDGGFPMVRGLASDGTLAQLVIWHLTAPWRLAFPEGTVPPDVAEREAELAACLRGERVIEPFSGCEAS